MSIVRRRLPMRASRSLLIGKFETADAGQAGSAAALKGPAAAKKKQPLIIRVMQR